LFVEAAVVICLAVVLGAVSAGFGGPPIGPDEGLPRVSWQDAEQVVGRVAFVSGRVIRVGSSSKTHFLDFEEAKPPRFKAVVFTSDLARFPAPLKELYEGKVVRIRGFVRTYAEVPEIQISDPRQVEVLADLPPVEPVKRRGKPLGPEITVATYNVENLFDDVNDPYRDDDSTPAKPREELERVARPLREIDADVVALQEVENRGYLERFVEAFLGDMGYEVVHFEGNDVRGIDVALLSRVPVGVVRSYRHLTFPDANGKPRRFCRDLLAVELLPPEAPPLEVWVLHLKSSSGGREEAEPVRVGEARKVRALLDEQLGRNPAARILVCGDFNDVWESAATQALAGTGATAMKSFIAGLPADQQITYNRQPYLSMIDFILASPAAGGQYVEGSYRVWSTAPDASGSDHNPVSARFRVK